MHTAENLTNHWEQNGIRGRKHYMYTVQFSSVQFAKINVVLSANHFRTTTQ